MIADIKEQLKDILNEEKYIHSLGVAECAKKLAKIYIANEEEAYISGLLHDLAKCLTKEEEEEYVKKYEIKLDEYEKNNQALSHSTVGMYIAKNRQHWRENYM